MAAVFYDTHAHLDYPDYRDDFRPMLDRARAAGIVRMITIGTDLESSARAIKIAEEHDEIFAVVGWHPGDVNAAPEDLAEPLRKLASHPKVVALGETGLDFYRQPEDPEADRLNREKQHRIFRQHLEVAAELGLNCVMHSRASLQATLEAFAPYASKVRGVFHCFVDGVPAMQRIIEMGSLVSFTGIVTFKNGEEVRATAKAVPDGKFMLETDAPYLAPVPYRGKRCEPAHVKEISEKVAEVRGCSLDHLSTITCQTAHEFFAFDRRTSR